MFRSSISSLTLKCRHISLRKYHDYINPNNYGGNITSSLRDISFVTGTAAATFATCATIQTYNSCKGFKQNTTDSYGKWPSWSLIKGWILNNNLFRIIKKRKDDEIHVQQSLDRIEKLPLPPIAKDYLSIICEKWYRMSDINMCVMGIIAVNMGIWACWHILPTRFMLSKFTDATFSNKSYTMLTSSFSHVDLWHIGFNMYALYHLGPTTAMVLGVYHFIPFYITSGMVSTLGSRYARRFLRHNTSSLGASGALFSCLGVLCATNPDMRVHLIFLPNFDFTISTGVYGMMLFDIICILSGRSIFDHFGHLSGTLFGLLYANTGFGVELWQKVQELSYELVKRLNW